LYVYRSYGIHSCVNVVCGRDGHATGVLLRGGEVVVGVETARSRRAGIDDRRLARGPGNVGQSLGLTTADSGRPIGSGRGIAIALPERPRAVLAGGRVGVSGTGGDPIAYPWRFVEPGGVGVSSYRGGLRDGRSGQPGARRWHDSARPYAAEPTR
jgi:DNA-3-methyladenine glycosylase